MAKQQDWFQCQKCGHEVMMKVLGDTATCSKCGGKMVRKQFCQKSQKSPFHTACAVWYGDFYIFKQINFRKTLDKS